MTKLLFPIGNKVSKPLKSQPFLEQQFARLIVSD
jgi:hypothetical protein